MADNFHFDITGAPLFDCLNIAWIGAPGRKATNWVVEHRENKSRLILAWSEDINFIKLPVPMSAEECEPFVMAWLRTADYGESPDHDGDNSKGWRVYNEAWGRIEGYTYSFVAIEPVWLMYGK